MRTRQEISKHISIAYNKFYWTMRQTYVKEKISRVGVNCVVVVNVTLQ